MQHESEAEKDERECDGAAFGSCIGCSLCLTTFLGSAVLVIIYGPTSLLQMIFLMIPVKPGWSWYCGLCALTSASIVVMIPIWPPLCMLAGLIFGFWWGALSNFIAIYTAACVSICIGRWALRERIQTCVQEGNYRDVRRMMRVLEDSNDSLKTLTLFRFLCIPIFIRNYGPATLIVDLWKLFVSAIPHSIWISILFASLGASFQDSAQILREGNKPPWKSVRWQQLLVFVVAMVVAIALSFYAWGKYQEVLEKEEAQGLLSDDADSPLAVEKLRLENSKLRQEVEELRAATSTPWKCSKRCAKRSAA